MKERDRLREGQSEREVKFERERETVTLRFIDIHRKNREELGYTPELSTSLDYIKYYSESLSESL